MKQLLFFFLGLLFVTVSASAAKITFTDNTFKRSNYSETAVFKSDPADTLAVGHCSTCGDPGKALAIRERFPNSFSFESIGFVNNTFSYDPHTQGAIGKITASVDKNIITNAPPLPPGQFYTNTFRPLIEQDGMFYLAAISGPTFTHGGSTGFNTISQDGLVAADFTQFNFSIGTFGTAHPDFAGDQMFFGLGQLTTFGPHVRFKAIYDNLSFTLSPVPDSGGTILLMFSSLVLLFARRPKRNEQT